MLNNKRDFNSCGKAILRKVKRLKQIEGIK